MRAIRTSAAVIGLLCLFGLAAAPPAARAFQLAGCSLVVQSFNDAGEAYDRADGVSPHGDTRDDPFVIPPGGSVAYNWATPSELANANVEISVFGIPTPLGGNAQGNTPRSSGDGTLRPSDVVPFDLAGVVFVSGKATVGGSTVCEGSGWVLLPHDPVGTPAWIVGAALGLIGAAGVFWNARGRHPFSGTLAGILFGAGLALLSITTGTLPFNEQTPLAELVAGAVLGVATGLIDVPRLFGRHPRPLVPAPLTPPTLAPPAPSGDAEFWAAGAQANDPTRFDWPEHGPKRQPGLTDAPPVVTQEPPADASGAQATPPVPPVLPVTAPVTPPVAPPVAPPVTPPNPALDAIKAGVGNLDPTLQHQVAPVMDQAEGILKNGPGTLTVPADLLTRVSSSVPGTPPVQLGPDGIQVGQGKLSLTVSPVVQDGRLALEAGDLGGMVAGGLGLLSPLNDLLDRINQAVDAAGQVVSSVTVTATGISVTTARKP